MGVSVQLRAVLDFIALANEAITGKVGENVSRAGMCWFTCQKIHMHDQMGMPWNIVSSCRAILVVRWIGLKSYITKTETRQITALTIFNCYLHIARICESITAIMLGAR